MRLVFSLVAAVMWMMIGCDDVEPAKSIDKADPKIEDEIAPLALSEESNKEPPTEPAADSTKGNQPSPNPASENVSPQPVEPTPTENHTPNEGSHSETPVPSIDENNTQTLDDRVRAEAERLGEDPNTYRMHVRTDPDGSQVYRMIGMYVIVNPNGEESFLPDEL